MRRPLTPAAAQHRLNGGVVDGSALNISLQGTAGGSALADAAPSSGAAVTQEDKPRAARVAELLAAGYTLSDDIAARAIALDKQHGLSVKFKDYLGTLDKSLGAQLSKHAPGAKPDAGLTEKSEAAPSGAAASAATSEKEAAALPVPGASEADVGPKTTTQVPGAAAAEPKTASEHASKAVGDISKTVEAKANEVLSKPQVKTHTDFVWSKLNEVSKLWARREQSVCGVYADVLRPHVVLLCRSQPPAHSLALNQRQPDRSRH